MLDCGSIVVNAFYSRVVGHQKDIYLCIVLFFIFGLSISVVVRLLLSVEVTLVVCLLADVAVCVCFAF